MAGGVSFLQFFAIIGLLALAVIVAGILVARQARPQPPLRHDTNLGQFDPGLLGSFQKRLLGSVADARDENNWLGAFLRDATADALAIRDRLPKQRARQLLEAEEVSDLPPTVAHFLDGGGVRGRWRLRRRNGIRPRVVRRFHWMRLIAPTHVPWTELRVQDTEQLLRTLDSYADGNDAL